MKTLLLLLFLALLGCEDPPPNQYTPQYVVQGFLIVGEPIGGITLSRSQSVVDTFRLAGGAIPDADVEIEVEGRTLQLLYRPDTALGEYYYPDSTELVRAGSEYRLRVQLNDGTLLTGRTITPPQVELTKAPSDTVTFPQDTIRLPVTDSLRASWSAVPGVEQYLFSAEALDTLEYGLYLTPPTDELNSRTPRGFGRGRGGSPDQIRWSLSPITTLTIPWTVFRWFGPHELTVYAPDEHFFNWFKLTKLQQQEQYDPLLGSIEGGLGVFGSATVVRRLVFVRKNQL